MVQNTERTPNPFPNLKLFFTVFCVLPGRLWACQCVRTRHLRASYTTAFFVIADVSELDLLTVLTQQL